MRHAAQPPFRLRPSDGWMRATVAASLSCDWYCQTSAEAAEALLHHRGFPIVSATQLQHPDQIFCLQLVCNGVVFSCASEIDVTLPTPQSVIASWFCTGGSMASVSKVSILDYFNIVFEGENGKIESNCKACGTRIQAKRSVTSNFVTHLKVIVLKTWTRVGINTKTIHPCWLIIVGANLWEGPWGCVPPTLQLKLKLPPSLFWLLL